MDIRAIGVKGKFVKLRTLFVKNRGTVKWRNYVGRK